MKEPRLDSMDRHELLDVLTDAMNGRVEDELLGGRLQTGRVKSRLLEVHPREASSDGARGLLDHVFANSGLVIESLDDNLWMLRADHDLFFLDSLNPRFWLLHSTATTHGLRRLIKQHLLRSPNVDSAWLSGSQLNELEGERRWIKSSFNSDLLQPNESAANVPRRWRVQVEGENPEELLALVSQHDRFSAGAALTAVGAVVQQADLGRAEVAADYQGSFVASGNSFHLVSGLLWRTLDRYEGYVRGLESAYRLGTRATEEMGLEIDGDVAMIELPHPVEDLEGLVGNLFTSREPFRLWAVPRQVGVQQWEANAVDLHVGHALRLEITPEWIRVLLGTETCGNTLARLVANLQHRFDARTHVPQPQQVPA